MMKFEIDDTKMDEAAKKKLVGCVGLLGLKEIKEPVEEKSSGFVDMRVVKPKIGEKYYFVDSDGEVECFDWKNDSYNSFIWSIGNACNAKEQAEYALERMKVRAELERLGVESRNGRCCTNFDASNAIGLVEFAKGFDVIPFASNTIYCGLPVFSCHDDVVNAIETVGADRIKKYLFNVWD